MNNLLALPLSILFSFVLSPAVRAQGEGPSGGGGDATPTRPWNLMEGTTDAGDASYGTASAWTKINGATESWSYVSGNRTTNSAWNQPNGDTMECVVVNGVWEVTITRAAGGSKTYKLN